MSRDLHDLVGHSLSAIALKGDLAIRLLRKDSQAAMDEILSLTEAAGEALAGLRAITAGSPRVTLAGELDSARALLTAAGVAVSVRGDISAVPPAAGEVLAWVVREGSTNILRHSIAATVTMSLAASDGLARLEILNDGARRPSETAACGAASEGNGLHGLAARIQELSGALSHQWRGGDRFELTARVPFTAPKGASLGGRQLRWRQCERISRCGASGVVSASRAR